MEHDLKTIPDAFAAVLDGRKTFEWRKDDRGYEVGDTLRLREWDPTTGYTGREVRAEVTYLLRERFDVPPGYCVMALRAALAAEPADAERDCAEGNRWCGEHDCGHTICPTCGEVTTGEEPAPPAATLLQQTQAACRILADQMWKDPRSLEDQLCNQVASHLSELAEGRVMIEEALAPAAPPAATGERCVRVYGVHDCLCARCQREYGTGRAPGGSDGR